ncbi:MAG: 50S ribosomal protein L32 [Myxococcota bacterium]
MPVPKEKKSRSKRDMRRAWHDRIDPPGTVLCPRCNEPKLPHRVCASCGTYRDREVFAPRDTEAATKAKKK